MREAQWRLAPAEIPQELPREVTQQLWQAAACAEAPPQLRDSPSALSLIAASVGEEFRAMAAIVNGLSSRKGRQDDSTLTARLVSQVDNSVHSLRSNPARMTMLGCASVLLVSCCRSAGGGSVEALAISSSILSKHDLLPLGSVLAYIQQFLAQVPAQVCPLLGSRLRQMEALNFHWSDAFSAPAPLAEALLQEVLKQKPVRAESKDLSSAALLQQPFADTPSFRKPQQVVQPGGHQVCQLHTATLMQWLGLGSTQVQVRAFKAIQHEAEESPSSHEESPSQQDRRDPAVLANGLLIYWRCSDGEGAQVRDSAGCGRSGALRSGSWRGPLAPDDPMEPTDEWGQALSPNFAVRLKNGELRYATGSQSDRQMLALVGGQRTEGEQYLAKAFEESEEVEPPSPGWTVELWARNVQNNQEEVLLFARGSRDRAIEWLYSPRTASFSVKFGGKPCLNGSCDPLSEADWVHLALRSNLQTIEVWVDGQMALSSSLEGVQQVPLEADLVFGPADLEITEVRIWGISRSGSQLQQYQHQCLDSLLSSELRGEAWKKSEN